MPARLACVKPAASVRSEPGSNSQVGLETLNRLITTFDEVPPFISPTIHIADDVISMKRSWCNLIQNVYRRSLRPVPTDENRSFQLPRPARTPPSTFLFLHLHLSNSPGPEDPNSPGGEVVKTLIRRQMTTDWDRLLLHSSK